MTSSGVTILWWTYSVKTFACMINISDVAWIIFECIIASHKYQTWVTYQNAHLLLLGSITAVWCLSSFLQLQNHEKGASPFLKDRSDCSDCPIPDRCSIPKGIKRTNVRLAWIVSSQHPLKALNLRALFSGCYRFYRNTQPVQKKFLIKKRMGSTSISLRSCSVSQTRASSARCQTCCPVSPKIQWRNATESSSAHV